MRPLSLLVCRLIYLLWCSRQDRLLVSIKELGPQGVVENLRAQRKEILSIGLNIFLLILGAQAYLLVFAQLPYLSFAALALLFPLGVDYQRIGERWWTGGCH